jgi:hypothetical protein
MIHCIQPKKKIDIRLKWMKIGYRGGSMPMMEGREPARRKKVVEITKFHPLPI